MRMVVVVLVVGTGREAGGGALTISILGLETLTLRAMVGLLPLATHRLTPAG